MFREAIKLSAVALIAMTGATALAASPNERCDATCGKLRIVKKDLRHLENRVQGLATEQVQHSTRIDTALASAVNANNRITQIQVCTTKRQATQYSGYAGTRSTALDLGAPLTTEPTLTLLTWTCAF